MMVSFLGRLLRKTFLQNGCLKGTFLKQSSCTNSNERAKLTKLIKGNTEITQDHMTPEIALHLITPKCKLWHEKGEDSPFVDPFWAFYWPGGQVLSRFILDNKNLFANKTVVDIGSGCGASAISAKMAGAAHVLANDIDKVALVAVQINSELNTTSVEVSASNLIGSYNSQWDVVLLGDMFYDPEFADNISGWIKVLIPSGITLYVGDPGRLSFMNHPLKSSLKLCAEYQLPDRCKLENNGLSSGYVWSFYY